MPLYGYARVSSEDQDLSLQIGFVPRKGNGVLGISNCSPLPGAAARFLGTNDAGKVE
jgi:hypothetical protein